MEFKKESMSIQCPWCGQHLYKELADGETAEFKCELCGEMYKCTANYIKFYTMTIEKEESFYDWLNKEQ